MSGKAQPCRHCGRPVVLRMTRTGRSVPFDNELIAADSEYAEELRYLPTAGNVMTPVADISAHRLEGVRWHAVRHVCAEWLRARQAEREARADQRRTVNWRGELATTLHEEDTTTPVGQPEVTPTAKARNSAKRRPNQ